MSAIQIPSVKYIINVLICLKSNKESSFQKRDTFSCFTCCKMLLRCETICEMNQKGENRSQLLSFPFSNKKFPEILQRPFFCWEWLLELCCLNSAAKKVFQLNLSKRAGQPLQISFNIQLGKCPKSLIRRL